MLRVAIVGTSCSGKTTLARMIADSNRIPHIELDAIYWKPNWTPLPINEFRRAVEVEVAMEEWVIDGNYSKVRDIIWSRANHLIWLNLPFMRVFFRAVSRTIKRVITKEELFSGNRETFKLAFLDRDSILWWVIRTHHRRKNEYRQFIDRGCYPHLKIYELRNSADIHQVLLKLSDTV